MKHSVKAFFKRFFPPSVNSFNREISALKVVINRNNEKIIKNQENFEKQLQALKEKQDQVEIKLKEKTSYVQRMFVWQIK